MPSSRQPWLEGLQFAAAREAVVRKARMRSASAPVCIVGTLGSALALLTPSVRVCRLIFRATWADIGSIDEPGVSRHRIIRTTSWATSLIRSRN